VPSGLNALGLIGDEIAWCALDMVDSSTYTFTCGFSGLVIGISLFITNFLTLFHFAKIKLNNKKLNDFEAIYLKIKQDIQFAIAPNFVKLSLDADNCVDLAIEIWRIDQKIAKFLPNLSDNQQKGLLISIQRLKRHLDKQDIEVIDHTNQKFNDGLNLDILSIETDPLVVESIVKETVEPTIMHKGRVIRKAKIILLTRTDGKDHE